MPMTPKELMRLLEKNGFVKVKNNGGSHQKFYNPATNTTIILPMHNKEMRKGLEQALLKQAGLEK